MTTKSAMEQDVGDVNVVTDDMQDDELKMEDDFEDEEDEVEEEDEEVGEEIKGEEVVEGEEFEELAGESDAEDLPPDFSAEDAEEVDLEAELQVEKQEVYLENRLALIRHCHDQMKAEWDHLEAEYDSEQLVDADDDDEEM